jgi:hypothetical protein
MLDDGVFEIEQTFEISGNTVICGRLIKGTIHPGLHVIFSGQKFKIVGIERRHENLNSLSPSDGPAGLMLEGLVTENINIKQVSIG